MRGVVSSVLGSVLRGPLGSPFRARYAWASGIAGVAWTPAQIPVADRLFWLTPATLQPLSGGSPYACTGWNDKFVGGLGNFTVTGSPNIVDPSTTFFRGGRRVGTVEADTDSFLAPGGAAGSKAFHDGTGATFAISFVCTDAGADTTQVLAATDNGAAAQIGMYLRYNGGANEQVIYALHDGSGTILFTRTTAVDSFLLNVPNVITVEYRHPTVRIWINGVLESTGTVSGTPNAGNPQAAFTVGKNGGAVGDHFEGDYYEIVGGKGAFGQLLAAYMERQRV